MIKEIKGVPRHSFGAEGEYVALDACGIGLGSTLLVTTEDQGGLTTTAFVRTPYERGSLHDWRLESNDANVALSHMHVSQEGASFIDRSVILKLGNLVSYHAWDEDQKAIHLGRIVALDVQYPYETEEMAEIIELPVSGGHALEIAA